MKKGVLGAFTTFVRCKSIEKYVLKWSEIIKINKFWVIEQNIDIFYPYKGPIFDEKRQKIAEGSVLELLNVF